MQSRTDAPWRVLRVFLQLGLRSFGGPVAHLGYFHREFVQRRGWLGEAGYAELVALCQFLPGPASSQVGIAIGLQRAGALGALAAWCGFTLPSALLMVGFAQGLATSTALTYTAWLHGLLIAAVAVVAQAVWTMGWQFCRQRAQLLIAGAAAIACLSWRSGPVQLLVLSAAALIGWRWLTPLPQSAPPAAVPAVPPQSAPPAVMPALPTQNVPAQSAPAAPPLSGLSRRGAVAALLLWAGLLLGLPLLAWLTRDHAWALADRFYRTGSLVFGGGHVVLPLLRAQVVPPGWISDPLFLAGYAAAQAVPGPLFSFAAFLGAAMTPAPHGWPGAAICLVAIFLPSFLLVFGVMPFWTGLRGQAAARSALQAVNAAVVGILLSALYNPVFISAIHGVTDLAIALLGLLLLQSARWPSWTVLLLCTCVSVALAGHGL